MLMWTAVASAAAPRRELSPSREAVATGSTALLDVPYLSQTEDLCGGAAVAMVLRYWGERQVYAEDFARLVDRSARGIRTDVLTAEAVRRGWQAFPFSSDSGTSAEWVQHHVGRGRPVIALIEVGPGRYHYVVIVAWSGELVIAHDPARAPFRVMSSVEFDRAWAAAGHWALLILPAEDRPSAPAAPPTLSAGHTTSPCGPLVQEMVALAKAGAVWDAEPGLVAASQFCPGDPSAWRELAGLRFLQSRWSEASTFAERAALLDPSDEPGWELLATSRFLANQPAAALDAWNHNGRPSVDLVRVAGVQRTRHPVVATLLDLNPRSLLTADVFGRATRRLGELPSAAITRLVYRPVGDGLAEVEAAVVESPLVPHGVVPLAILASRAWIQREIRFDVAAPAGSGELWTVAWRWWEARPRVAFSLRVPVTPRLPGVLTIEGLWQTSSYELASAGPSRSRVIRKDDRRRAVVTLADWASRSVRWQVGGALDRWADNSYLSMGAAFDLRVAGDRVSLGLDTAAWVPVASGDRFAQIAASSAWRSAADGRTAAWLAVAGIATASAAAPLDLWAGAGTGHGRTPLLRAHPLLDHGVLDGPTFGRRLLHGTIEYQRPLPAPAGVPLRLAAFADTASAWRRMAENEPRVHVDIGAGVRIMLPGTAGTVRADVARGIRDRRVVLSAGWQSPWPGR